MKKFTLLFLFAICGILVNAQTNLINNPSFENWTDGNPDSWVIPANSAHAGTLTWTQETSIKSNGNSSLKLVIGTEQNPGFQQVVPITAGETYTVSVDYYVVSGDGTDARIWSSFKNSTGFYTTTNWTTAIAADPTIQVKLQGSGASTSGYFTIANGTWGKYTATFVAPSDATDFVFECRTYKSSTVIWDNCSLVKGNSSGIADNSSTSKSVFVSGNTLIAKDAVDGTAATLYNAVGKKIKTVTIENGEASLAGLSKGLYIVKAGLATGKVLVK